MEFRDWPDEGEWHNPHEPQCQSTGRGKRETSDPIRCIRGENHVDSPMSSVRQHCAPGITWGDNPWVEEIEHPAPKSERDARAAERSAAMGKGGCG
jgi:hypothetical protein